MSDTPYRDAVGALTCTATMTRPDLSYGAHSLAKYNDNLGPAYGKAASKVLQYLKQMAGLGATSMRRDLTNLTLPAWADSDHVMCPDTQR